MPTERLVHDEYPRLKLFRRERLKFWQAQTFLDGRKVQTSLKTSDPDTALKLERRGIGKRSVPLSRKRIAILSTNSPPSRQLATSMPVTVSR